MPLVNVNIGTPHDARAAKSQRRRPRAKAAAAKQGVTNKLVSAGHPLSPAPKQCRQTTRRQSDPHQPALPGSENIHPNIELRQQDMATPTKAATPKQRTPKQRTPKQQTPCTPTAQQLNADVARPDAANDTTNAPVPIEEPSTERLQSLLLVADGWINAISLVQAAAEMCLVEINDAAATAVPMSESAPELPTVAAVTDSVEPKAEGLSHGPFSFLLNFLQAPWHFITRLFFGRTITFEEKCYE